MPKPLAVCISFTFALLVAPSAALAADVVTPSSVAASTTVPAGASRTLTLRCPATAVALNAAVTRQGAGITVRRSIPGSGPGDWRFRLSAAAGAQSRGVRAVLRCVRLAVPTGVSGARLDIETRRRPSVTVPAGSSTELQILCRRGFASTGYGLNRGARRDLTIALAVSTGRGWSFRLENTGAAPATAGLDVRCLKRSVSARRSGASTSLSFRLAHREFSNAVGPGAGSSFSHRCGRSEFSVSTGSEVDPSDDIVLAGSHPVRSRDGRWVFRQASAGDRVKSSLLCLNRRTQFG